MSPFPYCPVEEYMINDGSGSLMFLCPDLIGQTLEAKYSAFLESDHGTSRT